MASRTKDLFTELAPGARVLFIRLRSLGDCLLLTSPLRALRREFPDLETAVLVEPRYAPCFAGNPDVDEVLTTGPGKLQTLGRLVRERFDAIVNLHGGPTSLLYARLGRGRCYGLDDYPYRFLYTDLIPRGEASGHTVEATMAWFRWMGLRAEEPPPLVYAPDAGAGEWVRSRVPEDPYVVIHPGSPWETKRWAPDRFRELGRRLGRSGWKTVFTAGAGEGNIVQEAARDVDGSLMLLGLDLPRLAELIRGAAAFVGNDSGPMHLASAVGTPVVAVWGSSDSRRWRPWAVEHRLVQNTFDCNPCAGYRCHVQDTPACIESVTVDQVEAAFHSLVGGSDLPLRPATENEEVRR